MRKKVEKVRKGIASIKLIEEDPEERRMVLMELLELNEGEHFEKMKNILELSVPNQMSSKSPVSRSNSKMFKEVKNGTDCNTRT